MSEARIDASVNLEDSSIRKAQELQRALYEMFQDYEAKGQVAIVFDTRDHDPNQFPFGGGGQMMQRAPQQPPVPQGDGEAEGSGQYL